MSRAVVARPINGITLNGDLEFLLDKNEAVQVFDSPDQAKSFLADAGVDPEKLRHMTIIPARPW